MNMLQSFFQSIPYFVILIGILVFIHEAGHFLFAKLFKVKVHVFSLGFGPRLFGFTKGETEYKVSALPIGGYVKMLGEDPSEEVPPEDRGRAFTDKPPWQRFFIIIGGPVMNIVFPLFLHFGVGLTFTDVVPSEVGFVLEGTPAEKVGIRAGDIIEAINGREVHTFRDLMNQVSPLPGVKTRITVRRGDERLEMDITPKPTEVPFVLEETETVGRIGVAPWYLSTVVGIADSRSPAAQAGLKTFDQVVAVNGKGITRMVELEKMLTAQAGSRVSLTVKRLKPDAAPWTNPLAPLPERRPKPFDDQFESKPRTVALSVPANVSSLRDLGIGTSLGFVVYVTPGGVADQMGLLRGDLLVGLNGKPMGMIDIFSEFQSNPKRTYQLAWNRGGERFEAPFRQRFIPAGEKKDLGIEQDAYDKGFWGWYGETVPAPSIPNPSLVAGAIGYAVDKTWDGVRLIGYGFKLLFEGKVSLRSIGGPLMIGQLAGQAGQAGAASFFWVMALISLNLGLINLLPIPVLDGGQILLVAVEAVTNRPISQGIKEKMMLVGVAMLLLLMVFATWNDIARIVLG